MTPFSVLKAVGTVQQLRATLNGWSHRITMAAAYSTAAFILAAVAIGFLAAALFLALADAMSPVAAAAIVAVVLFVLATIAALLARHAIRRGRGGTGTKLPALAPATGRGELLGGVDPHTLYALAAGVVGGLIATQLRSRGTRVEAKGE